MKFIFRLLKITLEETLHHSAIFLNFNRQKRQTSSCVWFKIPFNFYFFHLFFWIWVLQFPFNLTSRISSVFKDIHRKNIPSSKTQVLTKNTNMDIWVIGTLNELFIRSFYTRINFQNKVVRCKTPFFVISPVCTHYYVWHWLLTGQLCLRFQILVLSTNKRYFSFLKKFMIF